MRFGALRADARGVEGARFGWRIEGHRVRERDGFGGRVDHLRALVGDARNTVLLTGFQAAGTRGEALLNGTDRLKIHGVQWPVFAEVAYLRGVSAHADRDELLAWLDGMPSRPRGTWVVHGEPQAQDAMGREILDRFGGEVSIPTLGEKVELR